MNPTPTAYFDELWGASSDPWRHAERWYEHRKYDLTAAAPPLERYRLALEPACGVGLLTTRLARRADRVIASDRFAPSVEATAARCAALPNVSVAQADVRDGPSEQGDLVVLGEVLYYFEERTVRRIAERWRSGCVAGGHIIAVHYRPEVDDHALNGDRVHEILRATLGAPITTVEDPEFLLDVFER